MKKMIKKVLCVAMAATMALSFSACTQKSDWPIDSETGLTNLTIGGIGPLTGDHANYGISVRNGAELAVKEINEAGGVNGFRFVLNFQDSAGDPKSAQSAYGKLMDDGMKVSLGAVLSGETATVVAAAQADKLLVLTPSGSAKNAIEGNDCAFRICFNDPAQGTASADYIAQFQLTKKVAVFYQNDTDYSKGLFDTFKAEAAAKGLEIVAEQSFSASARTDFSTQIQAIANSDAELIFIPIYAAEAATFLTQSVGKFSDKMIFFGCDGLDGILEKIDNKANAENVMMLTPFAADSKAENVQKFVSAYKAAYNETPDQFAADGYDAIYTIAEALKNAQLKNSDVNDFNSRIVAAMTKIRVEGVTGTMTWTADGEANKNAMAMIIHDGVAVAYAG